MLRLRQEGGGPMEGYISGLYDKDQVRSIWPEAYMDWVQHWEDTKNQKGILSTAFCAGEPLKERIIWPIDRP